MTERRKTLKRPTLRLGRTKRIVIGAAVAGVAAIAFAVPADAGTVAAPAGAGTAGTWLFRVDVSHSASTVRSYSISREVSGGNEVTSCFSISPGEHQTVNVVGLLSSYGALDAFSSKECPRGAEVPNGYVNFRSPSSAGQSIHAVFDAYGGHVYN